MLELLKKSWDTYRNISTAVKEDSITYFTAEVTLSYFRAILLAAPLGLWVPILFASTGVALGCVAGAVALAVVSGLAEGAWSAHDEKRSLLAALKEANAAGKVMRAQKKADKKAAKDHKQELKLARKNEHKNDPPSKKLARSISENFQAMANKVKRTKNTDIPSPPLAKGQIHLSKIP